MTTATDLGRRSRWLLYATIGWNSVEAIVAVTAGIVAGSVALTGFGFSSRLRMAAVALLFSLVVVSFHLLQKEKQKKVARNLKIFLVPSKFPSTSARHAAHLANA